MVHKIAAHGNIILSLSLKREDLEIEAKKTSKTLLPEWEKIAEQDIQVSEISGGITNVLWKLSPPKALGLSPVVLRVFGKQTDKIIDREREKKVLKHLNNAGFGAQVLATFDNGRIEEFLRMRPLEPKEMVTKQMAARIAVRLKHFHAVDMQEPAAPDLFPTIRRWLQQAQKLDFGDDPGKAKAHSSIDFRSFEHEIGLVQAACNRLEPEPCFAHNDLLSGNILVPQDEADGEIAGDVQFIDFEYGDFTYRTFDIANHFCEYAGFECDYSRFPQSEHIAHFMRHYNEELASKPVDERDIEKGVVECKLLALASHQFWGTWSILQAKFSPIDFDYMGYSKLRWDEYFRRKDEFLLGVDTFLISSSKD